MEISTDERFISSLKHLAQKFNGQIKCNHHRYVLNLKQNINQYQLLDCITNQIVTVMKAKYLWDRLYIKNDTLIKVLVNYDKKSDTVIANSIFQLTPRILLDSLYDFALYRLKCRWDEVIQLVNENHLQLTQKVLFNELLRFLILNMDYRIAEVHVMNINNHTTICDQKLQPLKQCEDNIINALIDVAPKQIFIHADTNLSHDIIEQIEIFFPNCICIEYNAVL